ncbi:MAG: dihydropteroate synthase [Chlorobiota bacterium]
MTPKIMGIVNVTPNSFSDGGDYNSTSEAITHALRLIDDGADIIDIGGESTRPGSEPVQLEEEISRTIPVIKGIRENNKDITISIDTTKYEVAKQALDLGSNIINDVSALEEEPRFVELAKEYNSDLILMHKKGTPKDMQKNPSYNDVCQEVYDYLNNQAKKAEGFDGKVIVDVGIGFGKTLDHNLNLLNNLEKFNQITGHQLLGLSRKSFIKMMYGIENPKDRDAHTAIIHSKLLNKDVEIIRVHNVKLIKEMIDIHSRLSN